MVWLASQTMAHDIRTFGDPVLTSPAAEVVDIDAKVVRLVDEMFDTLYTCGNGIGLAAPQVGVNKQVIVLDCDPENPATPPMVLINPTIKSSSSDVCLMQEGCLSIPGVYLEVKRPEVIEVSYRDEYGRPQTLIATELLSRAIQHEMDHLNGVLFVDRVENKLALTEEIVKHKFSPKAVKSV